MKEVKKRSLFSKIFGSKKSVNYNTRLELLNGYQATFTSFNGKLYDSSQIRTCIDAIARNAAKLNPKHIRSADKNFQTLNDTLIRLLRERPNELMNAYDFYYKIVSLLYLNNNAFVYILRDENEVPIGLYPINANSYELLEYKNEVFIKFSFNKSKFYTASLKDDVSRRHQSARPPGKGYSHAEYDFRRFGKLVGRIGNDQSINGGCLDFIGCYSGDRVYHEYQ